MIEMMTSNSTMGKPHGRRCGRADTVDGDSPGQRAHKLSTYGHKLKTNLRSSWACDWRRAA